MRLCAFARPDALEIGRDQLASGSARTRARHQADADGPENARRESATFTPTRSCIAARIHPERPASAALGRELDRLHPAIGEVLTTAIAAGRLQL